MQNKFLSPDFIAKLKNITAEDMRYFNALENFSPNFEVEEDGGNLSLLNSLRGYQSNGYFGNKLSHRFSQYRDNDILTVRQEVLKEHGALELEYEDPVYQQFDQ